MIKMPEVPMGVNPENYRYLIILYQNLLELEERLNAHILRLENLYERVLTLEKGA